MSDNRNTSGQSKRRGRVRPEHNPNNPEQEKLKNDILGDPEAADKETGDHLDDLNLGGELDFGSHDVEFDSGMTFHEDSTTNQSNEKDTSLDDLKDSILGGDEPITATGPSVEPVIENPTIDEPVHPYSPLPENKQEVEIPWDDQTSYFFMFGVSSSGKTVILSGLFYNILAHRDGDNLINVNDHEVEHQRKGSKLVDDLLEAVTDRKWPSGTDRLGRNDFVPRQMNMEFTPQDAKKPLFKFSTLDMSGEDLMRVKAESDNDKASLNPGIEAFLELPHNNLAFICVYPAQSEMKQSKLSSYMLNFINELDRKNHSKTPLLMIVSKWDTVANQYESPADFLKSRDRIIWGKLNETGRNISVMGFSIGNVEDDGYDFSPESSNKLLSWMYQTQMGISLDESISGTAWQNFWNRFRGK